MSLNDARLESENRYLSPCFRIDIPSSISPFLLLKPSATCMPFETDACSLSSSLLPCAASQGGRRVRLDRLSYDSLSFVPPRFFAHLHTMLALFVSHSFAETAVSLHARHSRYICECAWTPLRIGCTRARVFVAFVCMR